MREKQWKQMVLSFLFRLFFTRCSNGDILLVVYFGYKNKFVWYFSESKGWNIKKCFVIYICCFHWTVKWNFFFFKLFVTYQRPFGFVLMSMRKHIFIKESWDGWYFNKNIYKNLQFHDIFRHFLKSFFFF